MGRPRGRGTLAVPVFGPGGCPQEGYARGHHLQDGRVDYCILVILVSAAQTRERSRP